jgi:hypothetical protein
MKLNYLCQACNCTGIEIYSMLAVNAKMFADKNICELPFLEDFANNNFGDSCRRQASHECGG